MTRDVDSRDCAACARLKRFIYGYTLTANSGAYRYPGFVEREGVRYLGQSVLLVRADLVAEITNGLTEICVDFDIDSGSVG